MGSSDKWFRWSLNIFVFLMCFQLGMLLFLKSLFYRAEQRLERNKAQVSFQCGDFNNEESYWEIPEGEQYITNRCQDLYCPDSYWKSTEESDVELNVLAVKKARPSHKNNDGQMEHGHFVNVNLKSSQKPQVLVLVSQSMMQWNLQVSSSSVALMNEKDFSLVDKSKEFELADVTRILRPEDWYLFSENSDQSLKEVIIVGPELVWVDGLPEHTKLTYFSQEQICAYPTAWEEIANPENEFRRLFKALHEYVGVKVSSFQGREVGREMRVPFRSPMVVSRKIAEAPKRSVSSSEKILSKDLATGIQWQRQEKGLKAKSFKYIQAKKVKAIELPEKSMGAFYEAATKQVFLINNHQFGTWDVGQKKFTPIHLPLKMPGMYWPTAMTFNPLKSELYIYNDDRGGEVLAYNVVTKKWSQFATKVGYSLVALFYNTEDQLLYGTQFEGRKIGALVKIDGHGKKVGQVAFEKPLDFSKNRWKAEIIRGASREFWLKLTHPAHPGGDIYPLSQLKKTL